MRFADNCSSTNEGGSVLSILTIAIFIGSPDVKKIRWYQIEGKKLNWIINDKVHKQTKKGKI